MRRALPALLVLSLAGCGGGDGPLELVSTEPPAGAQAEGKRAERQGTPDSDAGERIYRLEPEEGSPLSYTVTVRNPTSEAVSVTSVVADEDRDGAFVPERVEDAPVEIAPGATATVTVAGSVRGCEYGGQTVPLAAPELELRTGGENSTQQLESDELRIELITRKGC